MIKTVAKITPEIADEIKGTTAEGAQSAFNPVLDANGNYVISLQTAQYLAPSKFRVIVWAPPVIDEDEV